MGVRLYSPTLGRFLSVDPLLGGGPNSYSYPVDPINFSDLDGRMHIEHGNLTGGAVAGPIQIPAAVVGAGKAAGKVLAAAGAILGLGGGGGGAPRPDYKRCMKLLSEIYSFGNNLDRRFRQFRENARGFVRGDRDYVGHVKQYKERQAGMRSRINQYLTLGCQCYRGIDSRTWRLATRRLPGE